MVRGVLVKMKKDSNQRNLNFVGRRFVADERCESEKRPKRKVIIIFPLWNTSSYTTNNVIFIRDIGSR